MDDRFKVLKSDIQAELTTIARLFEAIFRLVAEMFENHVPDTTRWHSLLLERMGRAIEEVRPPLLSPGAVTALDELRRFRHLFRHLYHGDLSAEGLARTLNQAHRLRAIYADDIGGFMTFLDRLAEPGPDSQSGPGRRG